jgi:DNA-binding FadR family transcriptional regulator
MHRMIYHALRDRDPEAARQAMSEHLAQSQAQSVGDLEKPEPHPAESPEKPDA